MKYYKIYNQNVMSEILLPEVIEIENPDNIDVEIVVSDTYTDTSDNENTVHITSALSNWFYCGLSEKHMVFNVSSINFEITGGNKISVFLPKAYDGDKLRTYILGTAFGVIMMQKGVIPIHAASIESNRKSVLLTGFSNCGKSTYLEHLIRKGYKFSADDVSMLSIENGCPKIYSAYPQRKTAKNILDKLQVDSLSFECIQESGKEKCLVRELDSWCAETLSPKAIIEITPLRGGARFQPYVEKMSGLNALKVVRRQLYRKQFYENNNVFTPGMMKTLLLTLKSVSVYRLIRPDDSECIDECVELIREVL